MGKKTLLIKEAIMLCEPCGFILQCPVCHRVQTALGYADIDELNTEETLDFIKHHNDKKVAYAHCKTCSTLIKANAIKRKE